MISAAFSSFNAESSAFNFCSFEGFARRWKVVIESVDPDVSVPAPIRVAASCSNRFTVFSDGGRSDL